MKKAILGAFALCVLVMSCQKENVKVDTQEVLNDVQVENEMTRSNGLTVFFIHGTDGFSDPCCQGGGIVSPEDVVIIEEVVNVIDKGENDQIVSSFVTSENTLSKIIDSDLIQDVISGKLTVENTNISSMDKCFLQFKHYKTLVRVAPLKWYY